MENLLLHSQGFSLFGLNVSWYGLIMALAMLCGVVVAYLICKVKGYDVNMPINMALYTLPLALIGARIYYCALHGVDEFWDVFKIWEGGMAIYGGVIGGFFGIVLSCVIHKYSLLRACDIAVPCLILGQAIGRIGCYFAGCCYGIEPTVEWLKVFPISVQINGVWHLSTFFYESFLDLLGFVFLMLLTKKTNVQGLPTAGYFIIYGTIRAVLETFRDPAESLMLGSTGIKASQLLSILLVILGTVMVFILLFLKRKKER